MPIASDTFRAIGTTNTVLATRPALLGRAVEITKARLAALDLAVSRFRPDSEVSRLARRSTERAAYTMASRTLIAYLRAALDAARDTDGLVDPTVGSTLIGSGYDADLDVVRARSGHATVVVASPGWRRVTLDSTGLLGTPRGCVLDLGATAKAHAADLIAAELAGRLSGGFLVNLGGDIAIAGDLPLGPTGAPQPWQIGVEDRSGRVLQVVAGTSQGFATSSTKHRTWLTDAGLAHHIVDPRTGKTAPAVWAQVTCAAPTALAANAASTAAIVLGEDAPAWLEARGVPARLDRDLGETVYVGGWPESGAVGMCTDLPTKV